MISAYLLTLASTRAHPKSPYVQVHPSPPYPWLHSYSSLTKLAILCGHFETDYTLEVFIRKLALSGYNKVQAKQVQRSE